MPYLLVGLGGALGSILRYALSNLAGSAWGNGFPWGTILINVTGSFTIGLVGTLTLPHGALPAGQGARLFLLVGVCGGYTTFSSFSLQTLDLMRGGEWLAALANVAMSMILSIAAVVAGHAVAEHSGALAHRREASLPTILAILNRAETARPVLVVAGMLANRLGESHVRVLHVRHDVLEAFLPSEQVMTPLRRARFAAQAAGRAAQIKAAFDAWSQEAGSPDHAEWRETTGPTKPMIAAEGATSRLIVLGHAPRVFYEDARDAINAALLQTSAPVVLAPEQVPGSVGRHVAIAWKPGVAADQAIAATLPILLTAENVTILIADEGDARAAPPQALLDALAAKGVSLAVDRFGLADQPIGTALLRRAGENGADLLVMGAYTHSRLAEAIFGGATREIVADAAIPVLLHR